MCKRNFKKAKGIFLLPDLVLTLEFNRSTNRKEILVVLRKDKEKIIDRENILRQIKLENARETTTVINKNISLKRREFVFGEKIEEFLNARLVITDRLHAMIFAAITGTPCVALDNKSKKVSGVYEWIKNLEYVKFCNSINDINNNIKTVELQKKYQYNLSIEHKKKITDFLDKAIKGK